LREEFIDFLTEKFQQDTNAENVAQAFEEHFSETPETHADRVSRLETGEAYNQGMLQAAIDSGISQVLVHDASSGTNTKTDQFCLARNGKVLTPQEAILEKKAHPNCSLFFSYLTTENLSLNITDEIPKHLDLSDDTPGIYDSKTETLYVKQKYSDGAADWMIALGNKLRF
jgi:hypothetical protein